MSRLSENDNPLCKLFINPVFSLFGGIYNMYRNYNCVPSEEKPFVPCFGQYIHRFTNNIHKLSVIFFSTETQSDQEECLEWSCYFILIFSTLNMCTTCYILIVCIDTDRDKISFHEFVTPICHCFISIYLL